MTIRVKYNAAWDEYTVIEAKAPSDSAYHTDCILDARDTAKIIAKGRPVTYCRASTRHLAKLQPEFKETSHEA